MPPTTTILPPLDPSLHTHHTHTQHTHTNILEVAKNRPLQFLELFLHQILRPQPQYLANSKAEEQVQAEIEATKMEGVGVMTGWRNWCHVLQVPLWRRRKCLERCCSCMHCCS